VQIDPIKPMLKPPGSERLKLEHLKLLSNFGFNFNLRRYTEAFWCFERFLRAYGRNRWMVLATSSDTF